MPPPSDVETKWPPSHPSKGGVVGLKEATPLFPTTKHRGQYLHAGIDPKFVSSHISSTTYTKAGYYCQFSSVSVEEGKLVPDCNFFSATKAQLSTHIRQNHLGLAITFFICNKRGGHPHPGLLIWKRSIQLLRRMIISFMLMLNSNYWSFTILR